MSGVKIRIRPTAWCWEVGFSNLYLTWPGASFFIRPILTRFPYLHSGFSVHSVFLWFSRRRERDADKLAIELKISSKSAIKMFTCP
jgi:hypothetical protein